MTIKYTLAIDPSAVIATDDDYLGWLRFIPFDDRNADYRDYQAWLEKGNTPEPPEPTPVEPTAKKGRR